MDEQTFRPPMKPELEAVVFDAGGTLVRLDEEWFVEVLTGLGVTIDLAGMRRAEVEGRRRYDAAAGTMPRTPALGLHPPLGSVGPSGAYFAGMLEAAGCPADRLDHVLELVRERQVPPSLLWSRPKEGMRHAMDALAALGVRMCCVSNSDGRAELHLERTGMRAGLEFVIDSQVVGLEKPDPRIFALALDRMGIAPERAVYIGDLRSVDAAGARNAGMHVVILDPFGDYAGPELPSVRGPEELPAFLASRFTLVPSRQGSRSTPS